MPHLLKFVQRVHTPLTSSSTMQKSSTSVTFLFGLCLQWCDVCSTHAYAASAAAATATPSTSGVHRQCAPHREEIAEGEHPTFSSESTEIMLLLYVEMICNTGALHADITQ